MGRILYLLLSGPRLTGGQKMTVRHVETLRELGFDAACVLGAGGAPPVGLRHRAPILAGVDTRPDDILVLPEDAPNAMRQFVGRPERVVVFAQALYGLAGLGLDAYDAYPPDARPPMMVVGPEMARVVRRMYPATQVELVPCFADERLFRPAATKRYAIACTPSKRPQEAAVVAAFLPRLHRALPPPPWIMIDGRSEAEVAAEFAASALFFSVNRAESVGITTLEAMASGCVCAGFLGVGGLQYGTADNGFWAPDDDCVAAADALARAAELVRAGGAPLAAVVEAGRETSARWSYARFRAALEETWMRLAPDARRRDGPLDA